MPLLCCRIGAPMLRCARHAGVACLLSLGRSRCGHGTLVEPPCGALACRRAQARLLIVCGPLAAVPNGIDVQPEHRELERAARVQLRVSLRLSDGALGHEQARLVPSVGRDAAGGVPELDSVADGEVSIPTLPPHMLHTGTHTLRTVEAQMSEFCCLLSARLHRRRRLQRRLRRRFRRRLRRPLPLHPRRGCRQGL